MYRKFSVECLDETAKGLGCKNKTRHISGFCRVHRKKYKIMGKNQLEVLDLIEGRKGEGLTKAEILTMVIEESSPRSTYKQKQMQLSALTKALLSRGFIYLNDGLYLLTSDGATAIKYKRNMI